MSIRVLIKISEMGIEYSDFPILNTQNLTAPKKSITKKTLL